MSPQKKFRVVALSSGGKDSTLAMHLACERGYKVDALLTMLPEDPESMLYHAHNVENVEKIARCMGLDWLSFRAKKDDELGSLSEALMALDVDMFVTGGIASRYQKDRFDKIASELGVTHYAPLWGWSPRQVLGGVVDTGLDAVLIVVAALGLDERWLGVHLTRDKIEELTRASVKYGFNATGEGGDFESFVLDGPLYQKRLIIREAEKKWFGDRGVLNIKSLDIVEKP
ncbi:MAG: diphthine--ammonia ligase [Thaumarchaeota archaeon]|nr:diphthine--ammonia ligase [Nitrososphaerota archaeon]